MRHLFKSLHFLKWGPVILRRSTGLVCAAYLLSILPAYSGTITAAAGGKLTIENPWTVMEAALYTESWGYHGVAYDVTALDSDGPYQFSLSPAGKEEIIGTSLFSQGDGGVSAKYTFTAKADVILNSLFVGATLALKDYAGGSWKGGDNSGTFPDKYKNLMIMSDRCRSCSITTATGKTIKFEFPEETQVMIQDNRQWSENYVLRIGHINKFTFKSGESRVISFKVTPPGKLALKQQRPITLKAGKEWIPIDVKLDIKKDSALDFSQLGYVDAPAGKYGRVIAKGPNFVFEKKPSEAQRFYGVNFCFSALYPEKDTADKIAQRLTRIGYNSIRIHHHDSQMTDGSPDATGLNEDSMRKFDLFTAACIREGIYLSTDLFISRRVPWRAIGIDKPGNVPQDVFKKLVPVHEGAYNNLKAFVTNWFSHVNPHTGRSYAKEPALAWINIINEGNFGNHYEEIKKIPEWRDAWKIWLTEKKAAEPDKYSSIPDTIPSDLNMSKPDSHKAAFLLFFRDHEIAMMKKFTTLLRDELGCKALITNANGWSHYLPDHFVRAQTYDYIDEHFYVDHPRFLQRSWSLPSRCPNTNPIKNSNYGCRPEIYMRHFDKPFTITEYNYSGPGRFRGVGGILTGTLAALQEWSGLWRFAYSHSQEALQSMKSQPLNYFDMLNDPLSLAAERASICLFLRQDIAPLKRSAAIYLPQEKFNSLENVYPRSKNLWAALGWSRKIGVVAGGPKPDGYESFGSFPAVFEEYNSNIDRVSFIGESVDNLVKENQALSISKDSGSFAIKTKRTCGGFTEKGSVDAADLKFTVSESAATIWVSSVDGRPVSDSKRMILTHLTDIQNTGIKYAEDARQTLLSWGKLPHLVRQGKADVLLRVKDPADISIYALDTDGGRRGKISSAVKGGELAFTVDTSVFSDNATIIYEIVNE